MADLYEDYYKELKGLVLQSGPVRRTSEKTVSPPNTPEQENALAEMFTQMHQQKEPTLITPIQLSALGNLKVGFKASVASELETLQLLSGWVSKVTGLPLEGVTEKLKASKEWMQPEAWEMDDKSFGATLLRTIGMVPIPLGEAIVAMTGVGAIPVIGKAALKVGLKEGVKILGKEAAKEAVKAGAKGVIPVAAPLAFGGLGAGKTALHGGSPFDIAASTGKGVAMGSALGALHPYSLPTKMAGTGLVFGGLTATEPGATREEVGAQTLVGAALPLLGGRKKPPTRPPGPGEARPPTTPLPGEPAGPSTPEMGRVMPWDVPARGERLSDRPQGPEPGPFQPKPGGFPEAERIVFSDIEPRPSSKGTTDAKASPEAQAAVEGNLIDYLVNKGYRRDVVESIDPGMLDWIIGRKKSASGKVYYKTTDPEKLAIRTYTDKEGETHKVVYKREKRFRPPSSFPNDTALINEMETVVSLSRYNKLMTELKSRVDKEAKGKVDTESLIVSLAAEEGVPGQVGGTSTVRFNQAAQKVMSRYPDKKITTEEFLRIVRDEYSIPSEDRIRIAKIVNDEGWTIKGSGETLDALIGRKAEEMLQDRAKKTAISEKAKDADASEKAIPPEWEKIQEEQINQAVKDKLVSSKEKFDKLLSFDEKCEVIDNLDFIQKLRGEMEALRLQGKLDKKSEHEFKKDIGTFKGYITTVFRIAERFAKEEAIPEVKETGGPFNKGDKLHLAGTVKKGTVMWSNEKETSVAIKEKGKETGYRVIPNEELMPLNKGFTPTQAEKTVEVTKPEVKVEGAKEPKTTEEALEIGKKFTKEEAIQTWNEYKRRISEPKTGTPQEQVDRGVQNQFLREEVEAYIGVDRPAVKIGNKIYIGGIDKLPKGWENKEAKAGWVDKKGNWIDPEELGSILSAKKIKTPEAKGIPTKGEVVVRPEVSPEAEKIAAEVTWMKDSLAHHGEKAVNALTKAFETYRNAGLGTEEAVIKARKDVKFRPKTKPVAEQLAKAEEVAAKRKGVTPKQAKEIATEEIANQVKFEYDKIKDMIGEKHADAFLAMREQGLSLEEAAIRVNEMRVKDREASARRVVIKTKDGQERIVGAKSAEKAVEQVQSEAERITQLAIEKGADPEIAKELMKGEVITPKPDVSPRPRGTEDLPNPNEVLLAATTQMPKVAEGLSKIKAAINRLKIKLDETARAAKILSEKRDQTAGNVELYKELQEKLAYQRGLRNNLVNELESYNNALAFIEQNVSAPTTEFKIIKKYQDPTMGLTVVMENKPGAPRFLAIQDERGMAGAPRGSNKYSAAIEVSEGKEGAIVKVLNLTEGTDPKVGYQLLDAIQEHYLLGKTPKILKDQRGSISTKEIPPKRVIREQGVGDEIWDMKQDKDKNRIINENQLTPKDIEKVQNYSDGVTESMVGKILGKLRGTVGEQENRRAIKLAIESVRSDIDPFQLIKEGEVRKHPSTKDYVPIADMLADPSQSTVPIIKWVGEQRVRAELDIKSNTQGWQRLAERWFGFIKNDPELNKNLVPFLHKLYKNPTQQMTEIGKQIQIFMDGLAAQTELKERGMYRPDYFTLIIDKNTAWNDYFAKPLRTTKAYEELPAKVQARIPAEIWDKAKTIADSNKAFDSLTKGSKDFIENNVFPWAGIHTDWMKAPEWLRAQIPKEAFVRFFQPRKSHMEFLATENFWDTLQTYINVAVSGKINNDFLTAVRPVVNQLEFANVKGTHRHYLDNYIKRNVFQEMGTLDTAWNAIAEHINTNILNKDVLPFYAPKKMASVLARSLYRGTISPDTALKNTTQVMYGAANSGGFPILKGVIEFLGDVGKLELQKVGIGKGPSQKFQDFRRFNSVIDEFFDAEAGMVRIKKSNPTQWNKIQAGGKLLTDYILSPMRMAEFFNRGVSYYAGLDAALKMGLDNITAHHIGVAKSIKAISNGEFAQNQMMAVNKLLEAKYGKAPGEAALPEPLKATAAQWSAYEQSTSAQFGYTSAHTSPYMMGTGMRFFTPFTSFPIKSLQFVANGLKDSWVSGDNARFIRFTVLTGFMATAPAVLSSMFGVDTSQLWGKGILPFNFMPAWSKLIGNIYTAAGGEDVNRIDKDRAKNQSLEALLLYTVPQYRYGKKIVKSVKDLNRGYETWGPSQHPLREVTEADVLLKLIGFPPDDAKEARELLRDVRDEELRSFDKRKYINNIIDLQEKGTESADKAIVRLYEKAKEEGLPISARDIMGAKKMREIDVYTYKLTKGQKRIRTGEFGERLREGREKYLPSRYGTKSMWSSPGFAGFAEGME